MKLRLALEEKMLDIRVRDRLLAEGKISKEDVKKFLDNLPDETNISVPLENEEPSSNLQ